MKIRIKIIVEAAKTTRAISPEEKAAREWLAKMRPQEATPPMSGAEKAARECWERMKRRGAQPV